MKKSSARFASGKVRYGIVGLGHIAQNAILPAFKHAKNSEVTAFFSDDPVKLKAMGKEYGVEGLFDYKDYDAILSSGEIDAVYICTPNDLHKDYCVRAARAGVHVLCEKPLAISEEDCQSIISACANHRVALMVAYRLHFERANLEAIEILRSGKIGEPRIFNSVFTQQVRPDNVRLKRKGEGPLFDVGVYCINASRYLFRDEPTEGFAFNAAGDDKRFKHTEEMTSAVLRFPGERLANFTCSYGAASTAHYEIVGTKGSLLAKHGYQYSEPITLEITVDGKTEKREYERRDQFASELVYFSDCILRDKNPEPSGIEGLVDVHIVNSLYQSAETGLPVAFKSLKRKERPSLKQAIYRKRNMSPKLVNVKSPSK